MLILFIVAIIAILASRPVVSRSASGDPDMARQLMRLAALELAAWAVVSAAVLAGLVTLAVLT